MKYLLCFLVLFICLPSYSGTINPSVPDSKYVQYGESFNFIVRIGGIDDKNQKFLASAVVVNENFILTAAHVVYNCKSCYIISDNKDIIHINEVICHKDFNKDKFGIGDIAIGKLSKKLELKFYPPLYSKNDELNKVCSIAGYGLTGNFNTGVSRGDGLRRAGSNVVENIFNDLLICSPSRNAKDKLTELEFLICSGDSGGGLFIGDSLAGINSCVLSDPGDSPNSSYGDESGHTRISKYIDWINLNMKWYYKMCI